MTGGTTVGEQDRDWHDFRRLAWMVDHWQRPGWSDGRRAYYWFLTFEDAPQVHRLAARCQAQLRLPFLDPVPAEGLHLTLHRVGFTDQTTPEQVRHILRQARARCADLTAFTIGIGPLAGSSGAVRLTASPTRPIAELRARLHGASSAAHDGGAASEEAGGFRPHVGIAYCNAATRTGDLIPLVAALRTLPTATTSVTAARLVVLRRQHRVYQWDTLDSIRLHTPTPARAARPEQGHATDPHR